MKKSTSLLFLLPFFAIYSIFFIAPIIITFLLSLHKATGMIRGLAFGEFIGLENYVKAVQDARFWQAVLNMWYFTLLWIPIMILASTAIALYIDSRYRAWKGILKMVVFLPYSIPTLIGSVMWSFMYNPNGGAFAYFLSLLGIEINLLAKGNEMYALLNIIAWEYIGYNSIILLAGLKSIPSTLYEAAKIDGAGALQIIRHIKLPLIRRYFAFVVVTTIIGDQLLFSEPYILGRLTTLPINFAPNMYLYNLITLLGRFGYSAALSFLMIGVSFAFSFILLYMIMK